MIKLAILTKDLDYVDLLRSYFRNKDFELYPFDSISELIEHLENNTVDIFACDIDYGSVSCVQIVKMIMELPFEIPIISINDCFASEDLETLLNLGVYDFVCKKSDLRFLCIKLDRIVKHFNIESSSGTLTSKASALHVDTERGIIYQDGQPVDLTKKEYQLVIYFLQNKNEVLSRKDIIKEIWELDSDDQLVLRRVDVFIKSLRKKIGPSSIKSVRGEGYRWLESSEL